MPNLLDGAHLSWGRHMLSKKRKSVYPVMLAAMLGMTGCAHSQWGWGLSSSNSCEPVGCEIGCESACGVCESCAPSGKWHVMSDLEFALCGWAWKKSNAVPDTLPLGSTVRSHIQVMETNAEATDFIFHRNDFVGQTAELTPDGKDKILEVGARMRSAPFPVLIERERNNSDPELDGLRRNLVAQVLFDLGNPDAQQRTVVSTAYGPGYTSRQAQPMYYQHIIRNGVGNGGNFNNGNFGGAIGGGGFGGGF